VALKDTFYVGTLKGVGQEYRERMACPVASGFAFWLISLR
jgi:hypothetical protein